MYINCVTLYYVIYGHIYIYIYMYYKFKNICTWGECPAAALKFHSSLNCYKSVFSNYNLLCVLILLILLYFQYFVYLFCSKGIATCRAKSFHWEIFTPLKYLPIPHFKLGVLAKKKRHVPANYSFFTSLYCHWNCHLIALTEMEQAHYPCYGPASGYYVWKFL